MKKILILYGLVALGFGCTANFEDINTNKQEASVVSPDLLLPTAIFNLANEMVNQTFSFGEIISQYCADYEYNEIDIYRWYADDRFWVIYDYLEDIKDIKKYALTNQQANYQAVALILESYCYSILTDAYGDVPYSESNKADQGIIAPKYDTQQSIYTGIIAALEEANQLIDLSGTISGDILYKGDMMKWKRFANSLRVRLLMRISKVSDSSAKLQQIVDNPSEFPVFESHADDAIYYYSGITPNISPYSSGIGREYEYFIGVPTTHLVDLLLTNNDPRTDEWLGYKVNEDSTYEYIGVAPGLSLGDIGRPDLYCSKDSSFFYDPAKINAVFMTASELNFILTEAAETGLINGDAKTFYENAVRFSFDQWGVELPDDFLSSTIPYEPGNLNRIYEQKWLSLYHSGVESWFDWKRTGKPDFIKAGSGNVNNNKVPVRLIYPSLEQSVNRKNYTEASQRIGGDNINTRVWWDKF